MRAIWKGAVSFGLVNVPVRLFSATQEHDIRFHQVHRTDAGRIRMRRICSACGEEVPYDQLAKGYEAPDGRVVVLDDEDFANLPLVSSKEIDVVEFVPSEQVDPILFNRTYYLEPEARAAKPYALLREALTATDRMAVVKVALRQRESMAVLRVRDKVIVMQTLLWPDEVRSASFDVLDQDVELRPQELTMAESLVESLAADFEPDQFEDRYAKAVADLVDAKLAGAQPAPVAEAKPAGTDVVDLLTALQRSVERARASRGETPSDGAAAAAPEEQAGAEGTPSPRSRSRADRAKGAAPDQPAAKRPSSTGGAAKKAPAKKTPAAKKAPAKKTATKTATKKATTTRRKSA